MFSDSGGSGSYTNPVLVGSDGYGGSIRTGNAPTWMGGGRRTTGGSAGGYRAWARGEWVSPDPVQLFALLGRNRATLARAGRASGLPLLAKRFAHWLRRNHRDGSKRNIEFHRGFWLVEATIEADGSVTRLKAEAFRFYNNPSYRVGPETAQERRKKT